jgi:hypothetical protein
MADDQRQQSKADDLTTGKPIVGVCIRYCKDGVAEDLWVDMATINAISWGTAEIKGHRPPPKYPVGKYPNKDPKGVPVCPKIMAETTEGVCWFDTKTNSWVCGD